MSERLADKNTAVIGSAAGSGAATLQEPAAGGLRLCAVDIADESNGEHLF